MEHLQSADSETLHRDGEEEERLPRMMKFGVMNDGAKGNRFRNSQSFKPTPALKGKELPLAKPHLPAILQAPQRKAEQTSN